MSNQEQEDHGSIEVEPAPEVAELSEYEVGR